MRLRKILLSFFLASVLAIKCVGLGRSISQRARLDVIEYGSHTTFALYTLALSIYATNRTGSQHAHAITHLSALTALATGLHTFIAILPSAPFPAPSYILVSDASYDLLWYTALALYAAAMGVSLTTRRGPKLHFPPEEIFSDKSSVRITSQKVDNVSGITSEFDIVS